MEIEKIYVINLDDKIHRWESKFKNLDPRMTRVSAIDSRKSNSVCEKFGLQLKPVGIASKIYFSQSSGAVGAYCSHYRIYLDMLLNNIKCALILEDDAHTDDVKKFLEKPYVVDPTTVDFVQLNKRHIPKTVYNDFNGFESYILTSNGATKMINTITDSSHFNGLIHFSPKHASGEINKRLASFEIFKKEPPQDYSQKFTIKVPIDKLAGFMAHLGIEESKRLKIKFDPHIDLYYQNKKSDICDDDIPWNLMNESQLTQLIIKNNLGEVL